MARRGGSAGGSGHTPRAADGARLFRAQIRHLARWYRPVRASELPAAAAAREISGRSGTSYEERVRLDLAYVTGWSLKSDASIPVKSFRKVFLHRQGAF